MEYYAHSANALGRRQLLTEHLTQVAETAAAFAESWGGGKAAYYAGWWHDIGKFHPAFQQYLLQCEVEPRARRRGPPHSHVGALFAAQAGQLPLAIPIVGHHSGLPDMTKLRDRLSASESTSFPEGRYAREALAIARAQLGPTARADTGDVLPSDFDDDAQLELFIRFVFSALVDADSLDAERHNSPSSAALRASTARSAELLDQLMADQVSRFGPPTTPVGEMRELVYRRCLAAADGPRGFYRLTVPTGGGKTRSSLAFALRHVRVHGLSRVITAIPYTSIIEQTAAAYREALRTNDAVLEHHSAARWQAAEATEDAETASEDPSYLWHRLAAENWDAPIVVTTFVRLFESLLSNLRGECRKLHNIADSVLILDEIQTLPIRLLSPLLDVLRQLVARYRVTVVLCSATLPAFGQEELGQDALPEAQEIVPEYQTLFHDHRLRRVRYEIAEEPWHWPRLATEIRRLTQCMVILNSRPDALAVLEELAGDPAVLHLSTYLCPEHRRQVLAEVKRRLETDAPCRLVTTQVVEAGVDLDFPVVFRAVGPLDRIVQAAGRCNREGKLPPPGGRVVVFRPLDGHLPDRSGPYKDGTRIAERLLSIVGAEALFDPNLYQRYFRELFKSEEVDVGGVQNLRRRLDYPEVARRCRLIDEDEGSVVVRYPTGDPLLGALVGRIRSGQGNPRHLLRAVQPYLVGVPRNRLPGLEREGLVQLLRPGLWEWLGSYDSLKGIALT